MTSTAILVVTVMAACFGRIVGHAFDEVGAVTGLLLGVLTGLAAGMVAAIRPPDPAGLTWRRIEFFAFPIGGLVVLALGHESAGISATVVTLLIVVTIRMLVESTAADLATMERMLDDRPIGTPADRMRLRMLGVGLLLATVAGYTVAVEAGFTDLARPAVGGQLIGVVVWFAVGIVSIGVVSRNARQRAWRVNGVEVSDGLADRWAVGVAGTAVLVVAVAVIVPIVTGQLTAAPAQAISGTDGLNRFVTNALELLSRDTGANEDTETGADDDNITAFLESLEATRGDGPDWLGYLLLGAVIGTIFVWAIRAGRTARFEPGGSPIGSGGWRGLKMLAAAVGREFRALIAALLRLLGGIRWRRPPAPGGRGPVRAADRSRSRRGWLPDDQVERRIARSFTALVSLEAPRRGETPSQVARSVGERTDPAGAEIVLDGYLRARYSQEQMQEATADRVEDALRRVTRTAEMPDSPDDD